MIQLIKKYIALSLVLVFITLIAVACANMATPSGGAIDLEPPKVVRTSPGFNATRVEKGKITIEFDENVMIKNPSENVIITPPQKAFPIIRGENRKVTVELRDTLIPNTTYTIDFTNSIVDNNEENPLENFSYSFSTGDVVDSLAISGKVLTADNLEPVKGIYVGLHSNLEDSAFTKIKFDRISRTNDAGTFTIRGVAPGKYKLYALDDANRDYMYDNPAEAIAFMETIIEPTTERAVRNDTIFVEHDHDHDHEAETTNANQNQSPKKEIDTIKAVEYTRFLPDNIVLRSFKSGFQRQFLQKHERSEHQLSIFFGAPTRMPEIEPLSFEKDKDWYILEKTPKNDTLIYWVKDPSILSIDTIAFRVTYMKTDSLNQSVPQTDTLKFIDRTRKKDKEKEEKEKKKKIKEGEEPEITFLTINNNLSSAWDTYKNIYLEFGEPIKDSLRSKIVLQQKKDSTYSDIPFQLLQDSVNPRKYTIKNRWAYGAEYQIKLDSASIYSIYGLWNNKLEQKFKVKNEDQYGQLAVWVEGIDSIPAFMEILDKSDKPIRKSRVIDNVAVFKDLDPGTYYFRVVLDRNNNGVWDTGDYNNKQQPEMVYYMGKALEVKANFEVEENNPAWRIDPTSMDSQKPLDITKQKPEDKEARRKKLEEKDEKNQSRNRNNRDNNSQGNNRNNNSQYNNSYNTNNYNNTNYNQY
ncbi:MAG: Ig-like domain-containing protein [Dysgonomonas sp.]